jgi:hypothetical protein
MSLLKVNNITGSSTSITFEDNVTFDAAVNISSGSITASFSIANNSIEKEKLTNDARDFANILNKPAGLISSSGQFVSAISGSSLSLGGIIATGSIRTTDVFSGSGAQLFGLPNAALNNNQITINGTAVSLGGSRTLTTTDISEGTNQYYTDARVKAKLDTETVVSSSSQINYQAITGQPTLNTLGSDGNKSLTITTGVFITASGGADGIILTNDTANYTLRFKTVGGTVSSSAQVVAALPANVVSSSTQVQPLLPGGTVSSSAQYPGWVTASSQIDYNSITNKLSGVVSASAQVQPLLPADTVSASAQVKAFLPDGTVSASAQYPGWITSSTQVVQSLPGGTLSSSAQYPGWVTASSQVDVRNTIGISTIATTGSNIFIGNQTISGSTTITGNLTVQGTSSVLFVTSSQLNVGSNTITLNTTDVLRFGGLTVFDSASAGQSGSLLWDSVNNVWLYVHAGTSNTSSIVITGPENTGALGSEQFLTPNLLPKAGLVGDHIVNSQISDNGTQVGIVGGLKVTGSITSSHIVPAVTDTFDLGSPTLKFRDLYLSGSTLYLGSLAIRDNGGALSIGPSGSAIGTNSPVSGAFTGSFQGNGSQLTNIANAALPGGIISSSTQLPAGTVSASSQYPGWVTASSQIDYNSITNKLSGVFSSSTQIANNLPAGTVSSSGQINAGATSNFATAVADQLGTVHSGSFMSTATTNNLPEGVTNLYYTDARVKTKMSGDVVHSGSFLGTATTDNLTQGSTNKYYANSLVLSYIDSLSVLSSSQQVVNRLPIGTVSSSNQISNVLVTSASYAATASLALGVSGSLAVSTDGLNEGSINLYYTDARVKTKLNAENVHSASFLGTATTTNLTEGINLYFTNQRAKDALPGVVSSSTQVKPLLPDGVVSSSTQITPLLPAGIVSQSSGTITIDGTNSIVGINTTSPSTLTKLHVNGALMVENGVTSTNAFKDGIIFAYTGGSSQYRHKIVTRHDSIAALNLMEFLVATGAATSASVLTLNGTNPSSFYKGLNVTGSFAVQGSISGALVLPTDIVSGSTQVKAFLPVGTVSSSAQFPGWVTSSGQIDYNSIQNKLSGVVSSSAQTVALIASQDIAPATVNATTINASIVTASNLTANQAVFTNGNDGLVSNAITGTGNVVMSASPTLTGTLVAANITATGTMLLAGIVSSSTQIDYNSIQNKLSGVHSSSAQTVASLAGQFIVPSGSNFQGVVSGSGTEYRLVVPVGTNQYAT